MNLIVKTFKSYGPGQRYVLKKSVNSWWPHVQEIKCGCEVTFIYLAHNHYDDLWTVNFQTDEGSKIAFDVLGPDDRDAETRLADVLDPVTK